MTPRTTQRAEDCPKCHGAGGYRRESERAGGTDWFVCLHETPPSESQEVGRDAEWYRRTGRTPPWEQDELDEERDDCDHGITLASYREVCAECGVEVVRRPPEEAALKARIEELEGEASRAYWKGYDDANDAAREV